MNITKPSIVRLLRKAGVKSVSDSCYITINNLMEKKIMEILDVLLIINSQTQLNTLMVSDLYNALKILNINLATSEDICLSTG